MEPRAALATIDSSGKITFWGSIQSTYLARRDLGNLLDMPESKLTVRRAYVGGAFGPKLDMLQIDYCTALLARVTGKPVKIVHTRKEDFIASRHKHPTIVKVKTGVKKDGTMVATDVYIVFDTGAYGALGPVILFTVCGGIGLTYRVPNIRYEGYCVYTNKAVSSAHRGFGLQQLRFAIESQVDMIAEDLGLDPLEIRLKNATQPGYITPSNYKITSNGLEECLRESAKKAGWKEKHGKMKDNQGIGIGCTGYYMSAIIPKAIVPHDSSSAFVKVDENGTVTLGTGAVDLGQGSDTVLCQIVAEVLGLALEDVRISAGDTETDPLDFGTWGSRATFFAGNSAKAAAEDAKQQIFEVVANKLEANIEDLEARDRRIYVKGSPEKGMSFVDGVLASLMLGKPILGRGTFNPESEEVVNPITGQGNVSPSYNFGSVVAEVKVDTETGKIKVTKTTAAQDVGFALNPQNCEGQLDGSIADSLGQTLYEETIEKDGRILNPSLFNYKLPAAADMPEVDNILVETIDPDGPFGAKGMSEATTVPPVPAIANAIYDAIGVRVTDLPITPESILKALKEKKGGKK
jgi:4-hydroxybenzoyl-CoA reductase subunit alpha